MLRTCPVDGFIWTKSKNGSLELFDATPSLKNGCTKKMSDVVVYSWNGERKWTICVMNDVMH
jgi:hypothetical protein